MNLIKRCAPSKWVPVGYQSRHRIISYSGDDPIFTHHGGQCLLGNISKMKLHYLLQKNANSGVQYYTQKSHKKGCMRALLLQTDQKSVCVPTGGSCMTRSSCPLHFFRRHCLLSITITALLAFFFAEGNTASFS